MTRRFSAFAAVFLLLALAACGPSTPTPEFTAAPTEGRAPLDVQFTDDASLNTPTGWQWDFGDGDTSTGQSPSHRYEQAGTFDPSLTASNEAGSGSAQKRGLITIRPGDLESVEVEETVSVVAGKTLQLPVAPMDAFGNLIEDAQVTWSVTAGGTTDAAGLLTAGAKAGEFTSAVKVTVERDGVTLTDQFTIIVLPDEFADVAFAGDNLAAVADERVELTATAVDQYGNEVPDATYEWEVDDDAGDLSSDARFTPTKEADTYTDGVSVTVTVGDKSLSATQDVIVAPGPPDRVEVTALEGPLSIGGQPSLSATAYDSFDNEITTGELAWTVDGALNGISAEGKLTAGSEAGDFQVTATLTVEGKAASGTTALTITPDPLAAVSLSPDTVEIVAGARQTVTATAVDQYGNAIPGVEVTLETVTTGGSVEDDGRFTASPRAADYGPTIKGSASDGDVSVEATASVTVIADVLSQVVLGPADVALGMSMTQQYVAAAGDKFGNRIAGLEFRWSVTEEAGGTIGADGLFTASDTPGAYADSVQVEVSQGDVTVNATGAVTVEQDRITFVSDRDDEAGELYVMNFDGTDVTRVSFNEAAEGIHSWSPDGRRLVYDEISPDAGILTTSDDGSWTSLIRPSTGLNDFAVWPNWSRDGKKIVYVKYDFLAGSFDLVTMDADGGNVVQLTDTSNLEGHPSWSPDGSQIVFTLTFTSGGNSIYVINADGTNLTRVTNPTSGNDGWPIWSPDGTRILFFSTRDGDEDIYAINPDGSGLVQITTNSAINDGFPSWSPDGSRITFNSDRDGATDLYIMDTDGSNVKRLTTESGSRDVGPRIAPPKQGVFITEASLTLATEAESEDQSIADLTASVRGAVVSIRRDDGGSGSGFIVDASGLIVTNNHVVSDAGTLTVVLDDGREFEGTVVGRDMVRDIAVVQITVPDEELPVLPLAEVGLPTLGQSVVTMGYPLGSTDLNITQGLVSSLKSDPGRNIQWVQTDAAVNPGNSGGPMVNLQGEVVGIITAKFVDTAIEGVGFAISASTIRTYIERLKAGETLGQEP